MTSRPRFVVAPARPPDLETCKIVTAAVMVGKAVARRNDLAAGPEDFVRLDQLLQLARQSIRNVETLHETVTFVEHLEAVKSEMASRLALGRKGSGAGRADLFLQDFERSLEVVRTMQAGGVAGDLPAISEVFDLAASLAERSYAHIMHRYPSAPVSVGLVLKGRPGHHPTRATTAFGASDCHASRSAEVHVQFARGSFEADEDYFGLLAKMHHELFVHAAQAMDVVAQRAPFGDRCPLAEGMVDRAAHMALQGQLNEGPLPGDLEAMRRRFGVACERQHVDRHRPPSTQATPAEKMAHEARSFGRMVFDDLLAARGGGPHALHWTQSLALRLNLLDLTANERRDIVIAIHTRMSGSVMQRIRVMGTLEEIRTGGSPHVLL